MGAASSVENGKEFPPGPATGVAEAKSPAYEPATPINVHTAALHKPSTEVHDITSAVSISSETSAYRQPKPTSRIIGAHSLEQLKANNSSCLDEYVYGSKYVGASVVDKNKFPENMTPAEAVQQSIRGLRQLDITPRLNLASFVTTWMEPECDELIKESMNINYINFEEYPSIEEIRGRCIAMLADLFHAETNSSPTGTDTVGSSEAILLGGLAMKRRWQERRRSSGQSTDRPNIVMGKETHVVWEKLANYFDLEARWVNCPPGSYVPDIEDLIGQCDENTVGVVAVLGTTYTGHFYDVAGLSSALDKLCKKTGWEIGIHVDGASGGFVAPFLYPQLLWDFRLPNVVSINASGHKFGLVYPGIGWVMFRSRDYLPESLIFHDTYLGSDQITFTLNFSKGASQLLAQYYQFTRLGRKGYSKIMEHMQETMMYLRSAVRKLEHFDILSNDVSLPLVALSLKPEHRLHGYDEFDISDRLRQGGFMVPAYRLAPDNGQVKVMRILCREDFTPEAVDNLIHTFEKALKWLDTHFIYTQEQLNTIAAKNNGMKQRNMSIIH